MTQARDEDASTGISILTPEVGRLLLESAQDAVIVGEGEHVLDCNPAATRLFGCRREQIVGESSRRFSPPVQPDGQDSAEAIQQRVAAALSGVPQLFEWRHRRFDGTEFDAEVSLNCMDLGGKLFHLAVVRDITARKQAERALAQATRQYRELYQILRDGVAAVDMDGMITSCNPAFLAMLGYTEEELRKLRYEEITPEQWHAHEAKIIAKQVMARGYSDPYMKEYRRKDGSVFPVEVQTYLSRDERNVPVGLVALARDVTERVQSEQALRASEQKYRALVETTGTGYVILDAEGRVVDGNTEYVRLTGHELLEEIRGRPVTEWTAEAARASNAQAVQRCLAQGWVRGHETSHLGPQGRVIPIEVNATVVHTGSGDQILALCRDITERKQIEMEREAHIAEIKAAAKAKDQFLAVLSHELRNPLAPIRSGLFILDRAAPGGEQAKRALAVIDRQVSHLSRIVDDLLDVNRISRGRLQFQLARIDLLEVVRGACADYQPLFAKSGVMLECGSMPHEVWIRGDRTRLAQALGNLLENAAKFTPAGGKVTVAVDLRDDGRVAMRVTDTGVGIDPLLLPRLFSPFAQADTTLDRSKGGLGLGLAIVAGVVEAHGGTVTASSGGAGKGAEFVIVLPTARLADAELHSRVGGHTDCRSRRVLIIEGSADTADSLREVLELVGEEVEVAYTGPEGLKKAREFEPTVVLCDIGLPGMDGYAVARAMRADAKLRAGYLVALTGYAMPEDLAKARAAGFDEHVAKPPSIEQLESILRKVEASRPGQVAGE